MVEPLSTTLTRTLLAQFFVAGASYAAYVLAAVLMRGEPRIARWTGAVAAGSFLATLAFHLLAAFHAFSWAPASVCVALLVGFAWRLERRSGAAARAWFSDRRFARRSFVRWRKQRWPMLGVITLGLFLPTVLRALVAPILSYDGLTYHGLKAAIPVQTGAVARLWAPGQWSYAGPVWGGHEILASWAMLPFHADLLSPFAEVVQFCALALALFGLAREARVHEPLGSFSVAAVLSIPTFLLLVGSAYVEIGAMMALASSVLLLVRALRGRRRGTLWLAAAALGVCTAMKMNLLPLAAPLTLVVAAAALRAHGSLRTRLLVLMLAAVTFAAPVIPWLAYGAQLAGAPLSPLPVEVAGIELGRAPPELEAYMQRTELVPGFAAELDTLQRIFRPTPVTDERLGPYGLGLFAFGLLGCARLDKRRAALSLVCLLTAVSAVLAYYSPSLLVLRQLWTSSSCRFLMPVAVVMGPLVGARVPARSALGRLLFVLLGVICLQQTVLVEGTGVRDASLRGMYWVGAFAALLCFVWWQARRFRRAFPLLVVCSLSTALCGLGWLRAQLRPRLLASEYQVHEVPHYWVPAALRCDAPTAHPRRIAVTSGPVQNLDNVFAFAFLGSALQNEVTYVTPTHDGRIHHFGSAAINSRFRASLDRDAWLARLAARGITHVMSFKSSSAELSWMLRLPARFRKLEGGPNWGFFELIAPQAGSVLTVPTQDRNQRQRLER